MQIIQQVVYFILNSNFFTGHLDFFPNNGTFMPGCFLFPCHHAMSVFYYIESVKRRNAFMSVKCNSWDAFINKDCSKKSKASMGHWLKSDSKFGKYYLKTLAKSPYGLGNSGIF